MSAPRRPILTRAELDAVDVLRAAGVPWEAAAELVAMDVRQLQRTMARRLPCPVCGRVLHYRAHLWEHAREAHETP